MDNYVSIHTHTDLSLLDSCTDFHLYVDRAVELGQKAIAFSEHGKPLQWIAKKMYCDEKGIKFLFAVECYLTEALTVTDPASGEAKKLKDNYHTILIARDEQGVREINQAITVSTDPEHTYYKNRITFDEFLKLSPHVITTSACLASPLNNLDIKNPWYEKLIQRYDFLEIQPHLHAEQIAFNQQLAILSQQYRKPLIAGTDAHSLSAYKAECRDILLLAKKQSYGDEDAFDLTYKSYDELVAAFRRQDAIPEEMWMGAIQNTNVLADMVEDFELDTALKYPKLYGSSDADREKLVETTWKRFDEKVSSGVIPSEEVDGFKQSLPEELRVFEKIDMSGYILCMSELISWCWENKIPIGPARGSVGGSRVAYVTDIIDLDPEKWHTVFSRFANEDRKEVGDIDVDVIDTDRPRIFEYLINRFGRAYTARVPTWGTAADLAAIELICMGLRNRWEKERFPDTWKNKQPELDNPYSVKVCEAIKKEFNSNADKAKASYPDVFYYYDGILGTRTSQGMHAAGMVVSPVTLPDNYGCFWKDGELVLDIDMEEIHEVSLVKFDLLVLNNIGIINDTCQLAGIPYPRTHEINWNDQKVWADMMRSPVGIFQMEGAFAFKLLKDFGTKSIFDMSLVTACIRPSGASYRNDLIAHKPHHNPSPMIDELLKDNNGYLIYQEDVIKFLQQICGLSGSEADNVRRAIARKKEDLLQKLLPRILDGYCSKSDKPRAEAEQEAMEFIQILKDASSYMFGYNHSIAYCLVGYICAWLRCYYPGEFITTYLNHAKNDDDITGGTDLAKEYGIPIESPRFELSKSVYAYDKEHNVISKGLSSLKGYGEAVCDDLYAVGSTYPQRFTDALRLLNERSIKAAKIAPLIKIDYFATYGNTVELARILNVFDFFKQGTAKKISKDKVAGSPVEDLLKKYATDRNAKGEEMKSYTITDMDGLLHESEDMILAMHLPDVSLRIKMQNQLEILGYVELTTGKEEDRRKLLVTDCVPLKSKNGGDVWGYAVFTRSIGSGKTSRLTLRSRLYNSNPIHKSDVIYASNVGKERDYWYLYEYEKVM